MLIWRIFLHSLLLTLPPHSPINSCWKCLCCITPPPVPHHHPLLPQTSHWVCQGPCLECGSAIGPLLVPVQCITLVWFSPWSPVEIFSGCASQFGLLYISALLQSNDFSPRTPDLYWLLCFSFYFLKSHLSVSLHSHPPVLPPFSRCFSTLSLLLLLFTEGGEDGPHNRQDSLKCMLMIHVFSIHPV